MNNLLRNGVSRLVLEAADGLRALRRTAHLMCGIGDYDAYVAHRRRAHPGAPVLDYAAFVRQRQDARYGRGSARCC
jgi:uncharacterized short protein YbdD (DUF466 family)